MNKADIDRGIFAVVENFHTSPVSLVERDCVCIMPLSQQRPVKSLDCGHLHFDLDLSRWLGARLQVSVATKVYHFGERETGSQSVLGNVDQCALWPSLHAH